MSDRNGSKTVLSGRFYRRSTSSWVQRYRCLGCRSHFSSATLQDGYRQKKRHKNRSIRLLLSSGVSQRRIALLLNLNRTTVVRKFLYLAFDAEFFLRKNNFKKPKCHIIEFDDLETFEISKCKPLSVTIAVESRTRRILGFEVSQMPAKGLLARRAMKYGHRSDGRARARERLFKKIKPLVHEDVVIRSDCNPHYPPCVKRDFPSATHRTFMGKRGSLGGQGELKKVRFDPLFSLNHTCAMLRANINRLFRKTWCTTKRADRLQAHLALYAWFHNEQLIG
jgi:transposase-like protein